MSIDTISPTTTNDPLTGIDLDATESRFVAVGGSWTREVEWRLAGEPVGSSATFEHRIADEEFCIEIDAEGDLFIRHPTWSLVGSGASLLEAERDLLFEASELKEVLGNVPFERLDEEARRLLLFLDKVA